MSHIGGDRFAPNVLVLPHGLVLRTGCCPRRRPTSWKTHRNGRLDLEHLRGRSSYPFAVQAAEVHLRRHGSTTAPVEPMALLSRERKGRSLTAVFELQGEQWRVQVRPGGPSRPSSTCRATSPFPRGSVTVLVDITAS